MSGDSLGASSADLDRWEALAAAAIDSAHEVKFDEYGVSIKCLAPAGSPCNSGCGENCGDSQDGYVCNHPRTRPLGYCNPHEWIVNDDFGVGCLGEGSIRVEVFFDGSRWLWRPVPFPVELPALIAALREALGEVERLQSRAAAVVAAIGEQCRFDSRGCWVHAADLTPDGRCALLADAQAITASEASATPDPHSGTPATVEAVSVAPGEDSSHLADGSADA